MRRTSLILGLGGAAAGIGVHTYLLVRLLEQAVRSIGDTDRLVVGIALGVVSIAAALTVLISRPVSAVFMLSLGALGLVPNLLTWAPAAALLIVAGALGLLGLRRPASRPASRPVTAPDGYTAPDGTQLHWSVGPRFAKGPRTQSVPMAPGPPAPEYAEHWGRKNKTLAVAVVLATAAVVLPFSLWPQESVAAASEADRRPASTAPAPATITSNAAPADDATTTTLAQAATAGEQAKGGTTTTTLATTITRIGPIDPDDPDASALYSDIRFGLTIALPVRWAELPASSLADYRPDVYHLASFADIDGPKLADAYLNGLTIKVLAGSQTEDPPQELMRQSLQRVLDTGPRSYGYFKVLKPIYETEVGGVPALAVTVRITWNERVMVKTIYTCIANHCLYQIEVQTDDVDWPDYQDTFGRIIESFTFDVGGATR